ncbi:MAG: NYN domain-containing protein [Acidobacteria bacterium]|nr:NYN domain-containing protein [Acidobacteriota bacterium]
MDTNIVTDIVSDSYELMKHDADEITLVAGDGDYVPTIERLRRRGFNFHVVFWDHASRELRESATKFISLNPYLDLLSKK